MFIGIISYETLKVKENGMSQPSREESLGEAAEVAWFKLIDQLGREPTEEEIEEELEAMCDDYCWDYENDEEEENDE